MRRSPDDAEDVLSGAMLKALAKMSVHADKVQDARAWLAQLTRNYCIDIHRRRQREIVHLGAANYWSVQPSEAVLRSGEEEDAISLDSALKTLPANQQEVVAFRFIGGKSYAEIAAHLNVSPTAVRKRIQRARIALKRMGLCPRSIQSRSHADELRVGADGASRRWYCVAIVRREGGRAARAADGAGASAAIKATGLSRPANPVTKQPSIAS